MNLNTTALGHWWHQRITALVLVPLSFWLIAFLQKALHAPYADTLAWLSSPLNALAIGLWLVLVTYHAALGIQVVFEDYVSNIPVREWAIRLSHSFFALIGAASLITLFVVFLAR